MKLKTSWRYKFVHCLEAALLIIGAFVANDILTIYYEGQDKQPGDYEKYKLYHVIFIFLFDMFILITFEAFFKESP